TIRRVGCILVRWRKWPFHSDPGPAKRPFAPPHDYDQPSLIVGEYMSNQIPRSSARSRPNRDPCDTLLDCSCTAPESHRWSMISNSGCVGSATYLRAFCCSFTAYSGSCVDGY